RCFACHNGLSTSAGEDVSIGFSWRPTMMANAARDPYWQSGVRREIIDHPTASKEIQDECSKCHMPMARYEANANGREGEIFAHLGFDGFDPGAKREDRLAQDGVSCSLCHQIAKDKLGTRESLVGGFVVDTVRKLGEREEYGPYKIENGQNRIMRSSTGGYKPTQSDHIKQSELCATCHTLITKALAPDGKVIGELPEQMPYQEWLNSEYKDKQSCQSCHMPAIQEPVAITKVLGVTREDASRHVFLGGNFFILRMLNRYRADLNVAALPEEFEAAASRTIEHLQTKTAQIGIDNVTAGAGRVQADITIQNLSGHKFPTAYPSRRAWLHVTVKDRNGRAVFESGALDPSGLIRGNDNDADAAKYEPHYTEISAPYQVQIYEDIMVDQGGKVTTGLLTAVRFIKDNRLLPRGFNKQGADAEIAVLGAAAQDQDFVAGGDKIRYSMNVANAQGPFQIEAELMFQPIGYRWANNLKPYDAPEPKRFVGYYESMASGSAVRIAQASRLLQ
ncbi:MAG TPA: hypothetical protein VLN48_11515, partial [Bryobacteraceae bacterium]|nr:hypothetical protein [Bryobacteraceae bacterium]